MVDVRKVLGETPLHSVPSSSRLSRENDARNAGPLSGECQKQVSTSQIRARGIVTAMKRLLGRHLE